MQEARQRCELKQQRSQLTQQSTAAAQHAAAKQRRSVHRPGNKAEQHRQRQEQNPSAAEPQGSDPEELQGGEMFPGGRDALPPHHAYCMCFPITARVLFRFKEKGCFTLHVNVDISPPCMKNLLLPWLLTNPHHQMRFMCTSGFKKVTRSSHAALT